MKVALYVRVSTDEQAKSGYSIPDQKRTLREYAGRENLTVVDEIVDDGYSGASLKRPGLTRMMELAESGGIEAAIAIKRDRFFRKRYYRLGFDEDLKEAGARLIALDDTGNKIGDGVLDDYAEYERDVLADRSRKGKCSKARAGKIVGGPHVAYGFSKNGDFYEVAETHMEIVRRIFEEATSGRGIRTIRAGLEEDGIPSPGGGERWNRWFIKKTIQSDLYAPHTLSELREIGVAPDVAERLEEDVYGVYRYEGIPVPVPHSGVDRDTVRAAREKIESGKAPSRNAGRFWELSGGIMRCGECGRYMQAHTNKDQYKTYFYYRCPRITEGPKDKCSNTKKLRAEPTEEVVWDALSRVFADEEYVLAKMKEHFKAKRDETTRPGADTETWYEKLTEIDAERKGYFRQNARGALSDEELDEFMRELDGEKERVEQALEEARNRETRLADIDEEEMDLIERYRELEESIYGGSIDSPLLPSGESTTPKFRHKLYEDMGLLVEVYDTGEMRISWAGGKPIHMGSNVTSSRQRSTNTHAFEIVIGAGAPEFRLVAA